MCLQSPCVIFKHAISSPTQYCAEFKLQIENQHTLKEHKRCLDKKDKSTYLSRSIEVD